MKLFTIKIKKLNYKLINNTGRNNTGKIVIKNRGGGTKYKLRIIDYKRYFYIPAIILKHENFRTHSATIALIIYKNGVLSYIISAHLLKTGDGINYNTSLFGNNILLKNCFLGSIIYNLEITNGSGAKLSRAAGSFCQILNLYKFKNKNFILLRLKSKKEYILSNNCSCVYGMASFAFYNSYNILKKAGQTRNKGYHPHVRGVAMNPIDHPHGGNTSGGRCSISVYGILAKGFKTRKKKIPFSFRKVKNK